MLLELDAELLLALWPASRVIAGCRVCRHLRETLQVPRRIVLRTGKVWKPSLTSRKTVAADLCRLQHSHVELLASACRLPVESVVEGMLLACRSGWTALSSLDLSHADVGGDLCDVLFQVLAHSKHLKKIDISDNELGPAGSGKVAQALGLCSELTHLRTARVGLSCAASQLSCALSNLLRLEQLDVSGNALEDSGVEQLATSLAHCTTLKHLDVGYNLIGERGGLALAEAVHHHRGLEQLSLCRNTIGGVAAEALAGGGQWGALVRVDLRYNGVGDSGVVALVVALVAGGAGRLEEVDLAYNQVSACGAEALAARLLPAAPALRSLNLKYNVAGDEAAGALAAAAAVHPALRLLVLSYNAITDAGAQAMAGELRGAGERRGRVELEHLHLRSNRIGVAGLGALGALGSGRGLARLRCLDVYGNCAHHATLPPQPRPLLRLRHPECKPDLSLSNA